MTRAIDTPCPKCHAVEGARCTVQGAEGQRVEMLTSCMERIDAAAKAHAEWLARTEDAVAKRIAEWMRRAWAHPVVIVMRDEDWEKLAGLVERGQWRLP